ncbi:hypothetical protein M153_7700012797 [Pseudoloma neurophilia]|uniref:Uncharacterized protein n=1 Tax=Pseudoloma neurophilia TaxID=146866 RepID=A0A0R0M0M8_9MICR|nr:hypothetical protein M153_7700012797 [Pseudoloma neurophilia]
MTTTREDKQLIIRSQSGYHNKIKIQVSLNANFILKRKCGIKTRINRNKMPHTTLHTRMHRIQQYFLIPSYFIISVIPEYVIIYIFIIILYYRCGDLLTYIF